MAQPKARRCRTMLRIAGRTMRPDRGLILRDACCASSSQDEGVDHPVLRKKFHAFALSRCRAAPERDAACDRAGLRGRASGRPTCWCGSRAAGLCHTDLEVIDGSLALSAADRARPRGRRRGRGGRRRGARRQGRRPRRPVVESALRPLLLLRPRPADPVRAAISRRGRKGVAVRRRARARLAMAATSSI